MNRIFYDLETEGLPEADLAKLMPEFAAGANLKDPAKIVAAIADKKQDWLDGAALKAITGKIVAVTIAWDDTEPTMFANDPDGEIGLIKIVLRELKRMISVGGMAYAWNGHGFDLPFLCQRAAVHNIQAFRDLTVNVRGRFYWHESLIDPKLVWSNYSPDHTGTSLKSVALALGVGEKIGSGKDFAKLLKENPAEATRYALADITLMRGIINRMGI
jgi:predicted PolB exonuclease-like 3'-5' exonuclease